MAGLTKEEREKREQEKIEKAKLEATAESVQLKQENDNLKEQLSQMMEMIKSLQSNQSVGKETNTEDVLDSNDYEDFSENPVEMNARIGVTSLTTGGVNLKTSNDGSARYFRMDKLGQTIPIVYEHLINCINTDRWLFEDGLVYINNANVVKEQYLEEYYNKFLTADKIEHILDFDTSTITHMVSNTTPAIQETIATFVANKINNKEIIDMNKVDAIGRACNPNIDIRSLADSLV